jgi:hypothetical protein
MEGPMPAERLMNYINGQGPQPEYDPLLAELVQAQQDVKSGKYKLENPSIVGPELRARPINNTNLPVYDAFEGVPFPIPGGSPQPIPTSSFGGANGMYPPSSYGFSNSMYGYPPGRSPYWA